MEVGGLAGIGVEQEVAHFLEADGEVVARGAACRVLRQQFLGNRQRLLVVLERRGPFAEIQAVRPPEQIAHPVVNQAQLAAVDT